MKRAGLTLAALLLTTGLAFPALAGDRDQAAPPPPVQDEKAPDFDPTSPDLDKPALTPDQVDAATDRVEQDGAR